MAGDSQRSTRTERVRARLESQAQPQGDGTFLMRPYEWTPIIYQVDAATKNRFINFKIWFGRFALLMMLLFLASLGEGGPIPQVWGIPISIGLIVGVGYGGPAYILRRSRRVRSLRWSGPSWFAASNRYSPKTYLTMTIGSLLITVLFGNWMLSHYVSINEFVSNGGYIIFVFVGLTVLSFVRYLRARR